jgi:flagellar FliJ protein
MTRSKRMQPVARLAESRQLDAVRVMGEQQQLLDEQLRRLDELNAYRDEYARRFEDQTQSMVGLNVRDYRLFLSRLNTAIEQQTAEVDRAHAALEESRAAWRESRVHRDAVHKVIDRFQVEERDRVERHEQTENDEHGRHRKPNIL